MPIFSPELLARERGPARRDGSIRKLAAEGSARATPDRRSGLHAIRFARASWPQTLRQAER
jgi:hypothetical protein